MTDRIAEAEAKLDAACDDWTHGKPSEADVERHAERIAAEMGLAVDFMEYGNPEFKAAE